MADPSPTPVPAPAPQATPAAASAGVAAIQKKKKRKRLLLQIAVGLAVTVAVGGVVFLSTLAFGQISGEEFSPDDFSRRRFYYYELPIVRIKVTPIYRSPYRGDLEKHLTRKGFVSKRKVKPAQKHWDLIYLERGMQRVMEGDSAILCGYLDLRSERELLWLKWTSDQPALAKVLWPVVAEAARRELYIITPELIDLAKGASDPEQFRRDLHSLAARKYRDFALAQQALGSHSAAVELFTAALAHAPGDSATLAARAVSYDALGEKKRAQADRAAAKRGTNDRSNPGAAAPR